MISSWISLLLFVSVLIVCRGKNVPCKPITGYTGLIIGQDFDSIKDYTDVVQDNEKPFGLMAYTALHNEHGDLPGIVKSIDYGSGIEWVTGLTERYPGSSIQLGIWMVDQCDDISDGKYDKQIDQLATYVNASSTSDFYIRIGYEFDSPYNQYPTKSYITAFQRIVFRFRELKVINAAFVWHAWGFQSRNGLRPIDWFPGATFVDWCGVSLFQQPYDCQSPDTCRMRFPSDFASFCKRNNLPLMIAESTPYGGIIDEVTAANDPHAKNEAGYSGSTWSRWFTAVLAFIEKNDVRIWCYINCDWDSQPMWKLNHAPNEKWGDTRIETHDDVLERWNEEVLDTDRYITAYDTVYEDNVCENIEDPVDPDEDERTIIRRIEQLYESLSMPLMYVIGIVLVVVGGVYLYDKYVIHHRRGHYELIH
mmetsp:Transcript_31213/g.52193  ORF Transcript_31213/g.52193 Transcript_31213/m.52193 type:complete len:421 (-) Transcript_31213:166-1428(-)